MAETDNLKLALPASNEYVDVEVLNENFRKIDTSVLLALAAAAPYSSEQTYSLGAYCTRGGKLYRCATAISAAEVWTDAHWTETTMGAELVAISIALANKAPAGYGLGGEATEFVTGDFNNYIKGGWYGFGSTAGIANVPFEGVGYGVLKVSHGSQIIYQEVTAPHWGLGHIEWVTLIRVNTSKGNSDTWSPWEWVNPPMQVGVEYRTTERYLEKPVYVELVSCGSIPTSGTSKDIAHGIPNIANVFQAYGTTSSGFCIPYGSHGDRISIGANPTQIEIETAVSNFDASAYSAYVVIKYIKTTD